MALMQPSIARRTCLAVTLFVASVSMAETTTTAPPTTAPAAPYLGTFVYRYGPVAIRAEVTSATRLKWTILEGMPEPGKSEEETVERREIRPDIFLATWVEKSGAIVTQVSDFTQMRATSTIAANGKTMVFDGRIERLPQ
ncbi:MAG: hypothetical protein JWM57_3349 [Phycisphaerales bacterium]|nr:hypothetical protein [Phycisphaerales bacterium]